MLVAPTASACLSSPQPKFSVKSNITMLRIPWMFCYYNKSAKWKRRRTSMIDRGLAPNFCQRFNMPAQETAIPEAGAFSSYRRTNFTPDIFNVMKWLLPSQGTIILGAICDQEKGILDDTLYCAMSYICVIIWWKNTSKYNTVMSNIIGTLTVKCHEDKAIKVKECW